MKLNRLTKQFLIATLLILLLVNILNFGPKILAKENKYVNEQELRYSNETVQTKLACQVPKLKVSNSEIDHFFKHVQPLTCEGQKNWVSIENATFVIDPEAVEKHGRITCDYENVQRLTDHNYDSQVTKNFASGSEILGDFSVVHCKADDDTKYNNVHASIKPSPEAIQRSRTSKPQPEALNLNVYMLGFDSVSHLTFMRKLPKTYSYIVDNLGGIVLEGYNIVGDGTPQALIPIFTGQTEEELPLTRKRYKKANYVNVYPFIWNEFKRAGYATLFGEDGQAAGTFQYRLKGFDEQPTDHYLRTFYLVVNKKEKSMKELMHSFTCISSEPQHKVHFRYSEDMFRNYPRSVRKFAFNFHSQLSHDDINNIEIVDDYMVEHLKFFEKENHLNDTILIFMSDHGHRFESLRQTQQGKLEERLPFFSFVFPTWFKNRYPKAIENFKLNVNRLTTPFDIYATLKSLLNFTYPPPLGDLNQRSISLFNEIPVARTCVHAGVDTHWCTCLNWQPISVEDERVREIAKNLVQRINDETERERKLCSKINLHKIESASVYTLNKDLINFKQAKDLDGFVPDLTGKTDISLDYYQVTLTTMPGNALYEASATWHRKTNDISINLNDVSHINRYGDLPHCVIDKDYFLAKWCVCYDKIKD